MSNYGAHVCFEVFKEYHEAKKALKVAEHNLIQVMQSMPQLSEETLEMELAKIIDVAGTGVPIRDAEQVLIQYATSKNQNRTAQAAVTASKEAVNQAKQKWDNELKTLLVSCQSTG